MTCAATSRACANLECPRLSTAYDARGNKTFEADGNGNASTWAYDYFGRLVAHTDIGGAKYFYTYDNARQLLNRQTRVART
ncbi:RHS repeat domain-containing protein [Achromobacter sp. MFA1 R4]|uniref:RHS repeat domain-containing protein n=1 Tax=Achromobacter sp. MFA1 R4 TaxID=1881016 RepID=UPI0009705E13|nr:RHS repeat domain-containing protein [Achromobacter sp. MFA1 R4]